jgi:hypothetical protein
MSTASRKLPRATAWTVVLVTVVGLGSLAATRPVLGAGALAGAALSLSVRGAGRSPLWTAVAAAALPLGAFGVLATLWLSGWPTAGLTTLAAITVGLSVVSVVSGRLGQEQVELVALSAGTSLLALLPVGLLTAEVQSAGGPTAVVQDLLWATGDGAAGLVPWLIAAGSTTAVAMVVAPPAVAANLRGQPPEHPRGSGAPIAAVVATIALVIAGAVGVLFPVVGPLVESVAASDPARGILAGVTVLAIVTAYLGLLARLFWLGRRRIPIVALGVGGLVGAVAVGALASAVTAEYDQSLGAVFVLTVLAVVALGVGAAWFADRFEFSKIFGTREVQTRQRRSGPNRGLGNRSLGTRAPGVHSKVQPSVSLSLPGRSLFTPNRLVPAGLVGAGILVAFGMNGRPGLGQVGVLVAIASALFVYTLFERGQGAATAVGAENVSTLPQAIWLGWTATLAVVGLVVAVAGILVSGTLTVSLSVPATAGVVSALVALVAGIWLLLRE